MTTKKLWQKSKIALLILFPITITIDLFIVFGYLIIILLKISIHSNDPPRQCEISEPHQTNEPQRANSMGSITNGHEFENYVAQILRKNSFRNVEVTKKTGDYGIDVLAEKSGIKYAVQCKLYTNPVGVSAVQEAAAGKAYYNAHVAVVATNSVFTSNAKKLANKTGVVLRDKSKLYEMDYLVMV